MKEKSRSLILPKKVGVFVQIFLRDDITCFPVATRSGTPPLHTGRSSRQTRLGQMPSDASASTAPPCVPRLLFAPSSEIHLHAEGRVLALLLSDLSAETN